MGITLGRIHEISKRCLITRIKIQVRLKKRLVKVIVQM